jgi:hypothetical protein
MFRRFQTQTLARIVLVWFALFVGLASAASWVQPHRFDVVCTASGGTTLVDLGGETGGSPGSHGIDCALCLPCPAPPPQANAAPALAQPAQATAAPRAARHDLGTSAAPPPGRGPPSFS